MLLAKAEEIFIVITIGFLAIIILVAIFFRYFINLPLIWTEELARFLYLWGVFIGMGYVQYHQDHTIVDYFVNKLPPKGKKVVLLINNLLLLLLLILLLPAAYEVARNYTRPTPILRIRGYYLFYSCSVGVLLMLFHHIMNIISYVAELVNKEENK